MKFLFVIFLTKIVSLPTVILNNYYIASILKKFSPIFYHYKIFYERNENALLFVVFYRNSYIIDPGILSMRICRRYLWIFADNKTGSISYI